MRQTIYKDPVCGRRINRNKAHVAIDYEDVTYYLCCPLCQSTFEADPAQYARPEYGQQSSVAGRDRHRA